MTTTNKRTLLGMILLALSLLTVQTHAFPSGIIHHVPPASIEDKTTNLAHAILSRSNHNTLSSTPNLQLNTTTSKLSQFNQATLAQQNLTLSLTSGQTPFVLPGTQILIFPIALVMTGFWTLVGGVVYGMGTYERYQFRESYRRRREMARMVGVSRAGTVRTVRRVRSREEKEKEEMVW